MSFNLFLSFSRPYFPARMPYGFLFIFFFPSILFDYGTDSRLLGF